MNFRTIGGAVRLRPAVLGIALCWASPLHAGLNYNASKSNTGNLVISDGTNCTAFVVLWDTNENVLGSTSATDPCPVSNGEYFLDNFQSPVVLSIPHVIAGGGWVTTLVLTNTTASAATASLVFYQETGAADGSTAPWNPPFPQGTNTQNIQLAPGATVFLGTSGAAPALTQGWGEATVSDGVQVYSVFTWSATSGGQGTAPASVPVSDILTPFDNTNSNLTAIAVVNPNQTSETITLSYQTAGGSIVQSTLTMPALGHHSFLLGSQLAASAGQRGVVEFSAPGGSFSLISLLFNPHNSFTTGQTYAVNNGPVIGAPDPLACLLNPLASGCPNPEYLLLTANAYVGAGTANPLNITILPGLNGAWNATVSGTVNGAAVNGTFVGGTLTTGNGVTFSFSTAAQGSTFTGGAMTLTLTETAFDAAVGDATGTISGQATFSQTGVGGGAISGTVHKHLSGVKYEE